MLDWKTEINLPYLVLALLSPEAVSESVVLLADEWLLQLPLEALKVFAVPQITSISRDFSLQFHYHRVHPAERSGKTFFSHWHENVIKVLKDWWCSIFFFHVLAQKCSSPHFCLIRKGFSRSISLSLFSSVWLLVNVSWSLQSRFIRTCVTLYIVTTEM